MSQSSVRPMIALFLLTVLGAAVPIMAYHLSTTEMAGFVCTAFRLR